MSKAQRPTYASEFRCIGAACEDSCCIGWSVYFDESTWSKYQLISTESLRSKIAEHVVRLPHDPATPGWFARVQMDADRACPFLNTEKLCQIQSEYGESYLSTACASYPRIRHSIDDEVETSLSLSCPEAARLVLLNPVLLDLCLSTQTQESIEAQPELPHSHPHSGPISLLPHFWTIRTFTIELLTNRSYSLWQRLFLLGLFTRRMDAMVAGDLSRGFPAVLREFRAAVALGSLHDSMDTIAPDLRLQLEMVLRLAGIPLPRSHVGARFIQTVDAFVNGLGKGSQATMDTLVTAYSEAYNCFYGPFFDSHPYILENLLINHVFRALFPFGLSQQQGVINVSPTMAHEFALLAVQFALYKGLLIGVAGHYREAFSEEHVVQTVQSAAKHFEHHPRFLDEAHALLVSAGLDNVRGLTMLLRN